MISHAMRILLLTITALVAFAANSILNRAALVEVGMDPMVFLGLRIISGAVMLSLLVAFRGGAKQLLTAGSWISAGALLLYAVAFSFAYLSLDAGFGALILFGGVQVTMFAGAVIAGAKPGLWQWVGSGLGLIGLAVVLLPGATAPPITGVALMLIAAFAWGVYSLRGRSVLSPLETTAGNFLKAAPVAAVIWLAAGEGISAQGALLAIASGALASGIGYAIWYSVLPQLETALAAIAQLTVPLIALGGGILFLGEVFTLTFGFASLLILGGVALAALMPARTG